MQHLLKYSQTMMMICGICSFILPMTGAMTAVAKEIDS